MKVRVALEFEAASEASAQAVLDQISGWLMKLDANPKIDVVSSEARDYILVYTDGGCDLKKNGVGACAYVATHPDGQVEEFSEGYIGTTNNRMEMRAVIAALEHLEMGKPIRIFCDSEYVIKGLTQWSRNWVRNGWKNRDGDPVKNADLWQKLLVLYQLHDVRFEHVKGHTGIAGNEQVDEMCTVTMLNTHKDYLAGIDVQIDQVPE